MSGREAADHARETSGERRAFAGLVRRMLVKVTATASGAARGIWQVFQPRSGETIEAEAWQGIGFAARPRSSSRAEAIIIAVGGQSAPAIVAARDEDLRKLGAADLAEDETAIFTSQARIVIKANGTVEIAALGGAAVALAKQSDLLALRNWVAALLTGGSGSAVVPGCPSAGTGTTVLKGQ